MVYASDRFYSPSAEPNTGAMATIRRRSGQVGAVLRTVAGRQASLADGRGTAIGGDLRCVGALHRRPGSVRCCGQSDKARSTHSLSRCRSLRLHEYRCLARWAVRWGQIPSTLCVVVTGDADHAP